MILRLFLAREAAASTGIGDGIALPHVRNPIVLHVDARWSPLLPGAGRRFRRPGRQAGAGAVLADLPDHAQPPADALAAVVRPARPQFREAVLRQAPPRRSWQELRRVEAALASPTGICGQEAQGGESRHDAERLVLLGIIIAASSGCPACCWAAHSLSGQWLTTLLAVLGAAWAGGRRLCSGPPARVSRSSGRGLFPAPSSAWRMRRPVGHLPAADLPDLARWAASTAWATGSRPSIRENGRKLRLFYGTLTAGMALLVIARNSILFLFGWEIMALSAFFLVTTEDHDEEVREAGWIYLVATHVATLCLFALFALLRAGQRFVHAGAAGSRTA